MKPETINLITNILSFILAIVEPVRAYLMSQPFNWLTFAVCIMTAIVAWFTGKGTIALKRELVRKGIMKPPTAEDLH